LTICLDLPGKTTTTPVYDSMFVFREDMREDKRENGQRSRMIAEGVIECGKDEKVGGLPRPAQ
jgi:hypothetical protein